jgi:hypothetical protein
MLIMLDLAGVIVMVEVFVKFVCLMVQMIWTSNGFALGLAVVKTLKYTLHDCV